MFVHHLLRPAALALSLAISCVQAAPVHIWLTTGDQSRLLARQPDVDWASTDVASGSPSVIEIVPELRYQEMIGFGAAMTDASAWVLHKHMNARQRAALMQELFSRSEGLGLNFMRLTIGASDFSLKQYSLDDMPAGQTDPQMQHFSIAPNREYVLPVVKEALAINPGLKIMASPWSAPGWMKSTGSMVQGTLKRDAYGAFALYLKRYLDAYRDEGIPIFALTLQNEPFYGPKDYPGMLLDPSQRATLIGEYVGPLLAQSHPATRILDWDHNWNHPESPLAVLADARAAKYVDGVAWHCYEGSVDAQALVHERYPDKNAYFTECSGGEWNPGWNDTLQSGVGTLIIGSARAWAKGVLLWNLALDDKAGPHTGGCTDCRGVVTIQQLTGAVTRNAEYYALAHASKFVHPGARRIGSNSVATGPQTVAFRNEDDKTIVLIAANPSKQTQAFAVHLHGRSFTYAMPPESVATFTWNSEDK